MEQGDHIDPLSGARLIPLPVPWWYGAATARPCVTPAPQLDIPTPHDMLPYRWRWTEDGYRQVLI